MQNDCKLIAIEWDLLRSMNGEEVEGLRWGAAMAEAMSGLIGSGLARRDGPTGNVSITADGQAMLKAGPTAAGKADG